MRTYILAGGKSSRMGEDKGLIIFNQQALITYVLNAFRKISDDIVIVTNKDAYKQFGYELIKDEIAAIGPIGGIYSALLHAKEQNEIFICACDMPLIQTKAIELMIANYKNKSIVASYLEKTQPLFGIYTKAALPILEQQIAQQDYKMMHLLNQLNASIFELNTYLEFDIFKNMNSMEDLEELKKYNL